MEREAKSLFYHKNGFWSLTNVKIGCFIVSRKLPVIIPIMERAVGSMVPIDPNKISKCLRVSNRQRANYSELAGNWGVSSGRRHRKLISGSWFLSSLVESTDLSHQRCCSSICRRYNLYSVIADYALEHISPKL